MRQRDMRAKVVIDLRCCRRKRKPVKDGWSVEDRSGRSVSSTQACSEDDTLGAELAGEAAQELACAPEPNRSFVTDKGDVEIIAPAPQTPHFVSRERVRAQARRRQSAARRGHGQSGRPRAMTPSLQNETATELRPELRESGVLRVAREQPGASPRDALPNQQDGRWLRRRGGPAAALPLPLPARETEPDRRLDRVNRRVEQGSAVGTARRRAFALRCIGAVRIGSQRARVGRARAERALGGGKRLERAAQRLGGGLHEEQAEEEGGRALAHKADSSVRDWLRVVPEHARARVAKAVDDLEDVALARR
eukprot:1231113-Pleurochrysis_carterae.AAC.1